MSRGGSRASSARFETVSIPVYAIIATDGEEEVAQVGAVPPVDVVREDARAEDEDEAEDDEQELRRQSMIARKTFSGRLPHADDVEGDEDDHDGAADDVPGVSPAAGPRRSRGSAGRRTPKMAIVMM